MEDYYNLEFTKRKLKNYMMAGQEKEFCFKIKGIDYMITPSRYKISFKEIGKTEEMNFSGVEELFSNKAVNGLILNRDWSKVEDIWYN